MGPEAGLAPRRAALTLLDAVRAGRLLSEAAPKLTAQLPAEDRARAQRLAAGTLRWQDRADRMLGPFLRMKPRERTHDALRLALFEVFQDGAAPHGAVNAAVALLRETERTAGQAGLANAVLRRAVAQGTEVWQALPLPRLPKWLRKPLVADYGKDVVAAMEAAHAAGAPLDLTVPAETVAWASRLGGTVLPTGSVRLRDPGRVSALPGYDEGAWWVQDAAAAVPVRLLDPAPGERVLDLCAAPGGKTLQLAAAGAEVTALDISEARMARVTENLARCRLLARTVVADALTWDGAGDFDAVLLDAPCTATGTIRRHPDLPYAKSPDDFPDLFALQARMIDAALGHLRPGGRLIYCTCSLLIDEGEEQVKDALTRHPGLTVAPPRPLAGVPADWLGSEGGLRLRPDRRPEAGGMDGFYAVRFETPGR
ncbi:methyltransferase domain-containing protein [Rhodobacteraceae bacterium CCMM004]|nr:methyltransferase domain-containing protein [Rhodobacteraceae bacterium CCMM004]